MPDTLTVGDPKAAIMSRRERRDRGMRRTAGRGRARREIGRLMAEQRALAFTEVLDQPARRGRS